MYRKTSGKRGEGCKSMRRITAALWNILLNINSGLVNIPQGTSAINFQVVFLNNIKR